MLVVARRLPLAALAGAIVLANVILLLGPPLISQDVFGYLAFARLGVLHGLDPYTHVAAEAPTDAVFRFIGWPFQHSPYGPLFTLASYAIVPLGPRRRAVGIQGDRGRSPASRRWRWWRAPRVAARASPGCAAAFVGLNPVLLVLAVGGAHNDTLVLAALALALALTAGPPRRAGGGACRHACARPRPRWRRASA